MAQHASALGQAPEIMAVSESVVSRLCPRLLDLGVTTKSAGTLKRVRVPAGQGGELPKLLFDRLDLNRLVEVWKDRK